MGSFHSTRLVAPLHWNRYLDLLHTLGIDTYIISKDTTEDDLKDQIKNGR